MRRLLLCASLVLLYTSSVAAKDWRGILPLHSTRADVEALLGPPPDRFQTLNPGRSITISLKGKFILSSLTKNF